MQTRAHEPRRALVSMVRAVGPLHAAGDAIHQSVRACRAGWMLDSETRYGFSISPEDGVNLGVTAELTRKSLGASGDATTQS